MQKILALTLLLLPGVNYAQETPLPEIQTRNLILPPGTQQDWDFLVGIADKDGNGEITENELKAVRILLLKRVTQNYKRLDENKNGSLTKEEYYNYVGKYETSQIDRFNGADIDGSGGLTKEEAEKAEGPIFRQIVAHFAEMDSDNNGEVTWLERIDFNRGNVKIGIEGKAAIDAIIEKNGSLPRDKSEK